MVWEEGPGRLPGALHCRVLPPLARLFAAGGGPVWFMLRAALHSWPVSRAGAAPGHSDCRVAMDAKWLPWRLRCVHAERRWFLTRQLNDNHNFSDA